MGPVDPLALEVAAGHLQAIMGLPARVLPAWPEPSQALLPLRRQYDAGQVLAALLRQAPPGRLWLGVTALDLCLPFLTHVFGEAHLGGRVAVISLHRLDQALGQGQPLAPLVYGRLAKVALHEAGHALGLTHCLTAGCLMRFSQALEHLDALETDYCPACAGQLAGLRQGLRGGP
ncbi:MAG: peptidase M54 [Pseudomonadota bacterium]